MLSDKDLLNYYLGINVKKPFVSNYLPKYNKFINNPSDDFWTSAKSPVQAASIDLHVGKILIPSGGNESENPFAAVTYHLPVGNTIIIEIFETIRMPDNLGGVVFPPSSLSKKGILVSNIGHVDPGYDGKLSFTVLNMGGTAIEFNVGDIIGTIMLHELSSQCNQNWEKRHCTNVKEDSHSKGLSDRQITELSDLSLDFADFKTTAKETAKSEANRILTKIGVLAFVVPMVLSILISWIGISFHNGSKIWDNFSNMQIELTTLNEKISNSEQIISYDATEKLNEIHVKVEMLNEYINDVLKVENDNKNVHKKLNDSINDINQGLQKLMLLNNTRKKTSAIKSPEINIVSTPKPNSIEQ